VTSSPRAEGSKPHWIPGQLKRRPSAGTDMKSKGKVLRLSLWARHFLEQFALSETGRAVKVTNNFGAVNRANYLASGTQLGPYQIIGPTGRGRIGGATTVGCGIICAASTGTSVERKKIAEENSYCSCANILSWSTPFADHNHIVTCSGIGPTGPRTNITIGSPP
jgi:hypothetical protein